MHSIDDKVIAEIQKAKRGWLFFAKDFLSFDSAKSVAKVLERMVKRGEVSRLARSIYTRLETLL